MVIVYDQPELRTRIVECFGILQRLEVEGVLCNVGNARGSGMYIALVQPRQFREAVTEDSVR